MINLSKTNDMYNDELPFKKGCIVTRTNFRCFKYILLQLILIIALSACGGGACLSVPQNGIVLGDLPTGATVLINTNQIYISNLTPATAILSVSGGDSGIKYNFGFIESSSGITVSPTNCVLTNTAGNNSCVITFEPNFASNGNYVVRVNYNVVTSSTQSTKLLQDMPSNLLPTPILVQLSGSTQVKIVSPESSVAVGVGTPIIVQFNNPIESSTLNSNTFLLRSDSGALVNAESITVAPDGKSAIFVVTSSFASPLNLNSTYNVQLTNGVLDNTQTPIIESSFSFITQESAYKVFMTASNYNGNLLNAANTLQNQIIYTDGVSAADYLCQRDSNRPNSGSYKAVIVDNLGNRSAYPTPINWVMQSYALYSNSNESPLFITGINPSNAIGNLVPPYYGAVSGVTFGNFWLNKLVGINRANYSSGVLQNWTSSAITCDSWTSSAANTYRSYAQYNPLFFTPPLPYQTGIQLSGSSACNLTSYALLCVQQP